MTPPADSIYCACGAQWHGRYTTSPIIHAHRLGGYNAALPYCGHQCVLISHKEYKARYRCHCDRCKVQHQRGRR